MPTPTITDVFRIVMLWDAAQGVSPRNVFHVRGTGLTVSDVAAAVNAGFVAGDAAGNMWDSLSTVYQATSFSIQKLDGASGAIDEAITSGNQVGGSSGSVLPQVAGVVSFKTGLLGPRHRGRQYIGPVGEGGVAGGTLDPTLQGHMLDGWDAFVSSLIGDACSLVVASYVHSDANDVISVRVDTLTGTQRRRMDQLR